MLFDSAASARAIARIESVGVSSKAKWGSLDAPGMLAHCRLALDTAVGQGPRKQVLLGKLLAWTVKKKLVDTDAPFKPGSPTDPSMIDGDATDLEREKKALVESVRAFTALGPEGMPKGPHPFFGKMTPEQWERLMSKHLDHHLTQFGV